MIPRRLEDLANEKTDELSLSVLLEICCVSTLKMVATCAGFGRAQADARQITPSLMVVTLPIEWNRGKIATLCK
jgi:hypothetical protein